MINTSDTSSVKNASGNIFLVGFMGSGKSYWGRIWAEQAGREFYDLDEMVEAKNGKTVAAIFDKEGEDFFRQQETEALLGFADRRNCIIACGGGTACFNNNMQWMNNYGTTIYLAATPTYIFNHVINEKNKRPLIKKLNEAELLFFIEQKLKEREVFYTQATYTLLVEELNDNSISSFNS